MKTETLKIKGMHCTSCSINLERTLKDLDGVENATVNFATATAVVTYDEATVGMPELEQAVKSIGFSIVQEGEVKKKGFQIFKRKK